MKIILQSLGITLLESIGLLILYPLAFVSAIASIPFYIADKFIMFCIKKLGIEKPDYSDKTTYIGDYIVSILSYLIISIILMMGAIFLYEYLLTPVNIRSLIFGMPNGPLNPSTATSIFKNYEKAHESGFIFTFITIIAGIIIEILDFAVFFVLSKTRDNPYKLTPTEKTAALLFVLIIIAIPLYKMGDYSMFFTLAALFVGYFFWIQSDMKGALVKLVELLKIRSFFYHVLILVMIDILLAFSSKFNSDTTIYSVTSVLFIGMIANFMSIGVIRFYLEKCRSTTMEHWSVTASNIVFYASYVKEKISAWLSSVKQSAERILWSTGKKIRRKYRIFKARLRRLKMRIKKATAPRPGKKKDA